MAKLTELEIKIRPKFSIDTDTAYQCLMLLEMYCNSHNKKVESFIRKSTEEDAEWQINLELKDNELNEVKENE